MLRLPKKLFRFLLVAAVLGNAGATAIGGERTMGTPQAAVVDPLSVRSLFLRVLAMGKPVCRATGFVVRRGMQDYLLTNWHVVTGRDPITDKAICTGDAKPDALQIYHHGKVLGTWSPTIETLFDGQGRQRWIEHPKGRKIDVVALPLKNITEGVTLYPLDLKLADADMVPVVAMPVSVVGFPGGMRGENRFPIWKTGHIASDPDLNYDGEPRFLIDATARPGMSGSPVFLRLTGGYATRSGAVVMAQSGIRTRFLGVFSALYTEAEIGSVWKPVVIDEILPPE